MNWKADKSDPYTLLHGPYLRTVRGTDARAPCAPLSSKSQDFYARARRTGGHGYGTTFSSFDSLYSPPSEDPSSGVSPSMILFCAPPSSPPPPYTPP